MVNLVNDAYKNVSHDTIDSWVEKFHRDGFLFLREVLHPDFVQVLKDDLEDALAEKIDVDTDMKLRKQMFEVSTATVDLFELEPIVTFAETLVAPNCHVFHNNSFKTLPGGGISGWHQDDDLHYIVTEGEAPTNVRLPVLFFTANYYLTDVDEVDQGATQLVRGSHLFGRMPPTSTGAVSGTENALEGTEFEKDIFDCIGKAGSVIMFNNQVWHRGSRNLSDHTRCITQVSYGRRVIGHMYPPFMNYQMPEHVYKNADERRMRLLGFKKSGAYG